MKYRFKYKKKRGKLACSSNTTVFLTIIVAQSYARWRWQRSACYVPSAGPYYDFSLECSGIRLDGKKESTNCACVVQEVGQYAQGKKKIVF